MSGTFLTLCEHFLSTCEAKLPIGPVSNNNELDIVVEISDPYLGIASDSLSVTVTKLVSHTILTC